ncbi:VanZ family protein [Cellulomonas sp. P22]|uniref:VanZ family protein n=1 Tax=Cellulomonas sp. P22 TaxID=3373189 RepID=UPI0037AAE930
MTRPPRRVLGALVAAGAVVAVVTLSPVPLQQVLDRPLGRVLALLHGWGLPGSAHLAEAAANVALFVPLGLLAALVLARRWWWAVLVGAALASLTIEVVQHAVLAQRVGSARDVLANTLGTLVGIGLAAVWQRVRRRRASGLAPVAGHGGRG